ncbi:MAG TPA: amidohydrolase family protein [Anaerolineaceae bacterium]|nr:amidohydrolase family protein [Anaerolineaceae bacterium]
MKECNTILKNALILTMDNNYTQYQQGAVAINDGAIVAIGPEDAILKSWNGKEIIDCQGKVLMPGLINTHTHVPMTLLRGLANDLRLDVWLMGYMMPVEREFVSPEFVRLGTQMGCAEMIKSGVTTFNDMYYFEDEVATATAEIGMRAVVGQTVMKFSAPDAASYDDSLALSIDLIKKWKDHHLIVPAIAPHAVYTCPAEVLEAVVEIAKQYDATVHFHVSETADEVVNMRKQSGMPVVPYIKKLGMLDTKLIAAHCVHVDDGEIRTMRRAGTGIAHNPSSNLKLASGFAPTARMMEMGAKVGIGTDGAASNNDLDMFEEMRLASLIAKPVAGDPTVLPARQVLEMATRIGAEVLHLDHITGSLEVGKRADIIVLDIFPIHNQPHFKRDSENIYAQIVYASKASDVTDVMVDGQWLMRNKTLLTIDEDALIRQAKPVAEQIDAFITSREKSVHSKLLAIGGAAEEESFEVQAKVRISDPDEIIERLEHPEIEILKRRHYHQYDSYFLFEDSTQGILRYREDEILNKKGDIQNVRGRLTLIGEGSDDVGKQLKQGLLSRSRYFAPATHSQRFYIEYFKPVEMMEIEKDRRRFLVKFKGVEFYINVDTIIKPIEDYFVEIKSRTWSRQDADEKTHLIIYLADVLGLSTQQIINKDYFQLLRNR